MSKKIGSFILVAIVAVLVVTGYRYISYRTTNAVSDAAFIKSDSLSILSFQVGGKVEKLFVEQNQKVQKGQLIAQIDPSDIELTKKELQHKQKALTQKIAALKTRKKRLQTSLELKTQIAKTSIEQIQEQKKATAYEVESMQAKLAKLQNDQKRFEKMYKQNLISKSDLENIQTQVKSLQKTLLALKEKLPLLQTRQTKATLALKLAKAQLVEVKELQKQIDANLQELESLKSLVEKADRQLSYTKLYAPFSGVIAKKFFDAPKVLKAGTPVVALVDDSKLYCEVLLSEKKLKGVRVGNDVTVSVDALNGKKIDAKVESIAPTSASTFSLVPRDIASGEFTKLDQRFAVRIRLEDTKGLRAGMGASVAIERK